MNKIFKALYHINVRPVLAGPLSFSRATMAVVLVLDLISTENTVEKVVIQLRRLQTQKANKSG